MKRSGLTLADIKCEISALVGSNINMQVNRGRKRIEHYTGTIDSIYPSVFTVRITNNVNLDNATYSYSDVLCGDVRICRAE